jgi:hypothetical protein
LLDSKTVFDGNVILIISKPERRRLGNIISATGKDMDMLMNILKTGVNKEGFMIVKLSAVILNT